MKKLLSLFLTSVMCLALSVPVFAASTTSEFVSLSREQYISEKAERLGISYDQAAVIVDENIQDTLAVIPMPLDGFDATGGSTDAHGVNTAYGYIVYNRVVPQTGSMMKVRLTAYAVVISGPPGRYIAEVEPPNAMPGSSGDYTIQASCNTTLSGDKQSVTISASGNAEVTLQVASNIGLSAEIISIGQSFGSSTYLRYPFTVGATYRV